MRDTVSPRCTCSILHIDDDPRFRELMREILGELIGNGCVFAEGHDGSDAGTLFAEHRPDVVLMDVDMTEVDGITATRAITEKFPDAFVVILTNYDCRTFRVAADEAGASAYALKDDLDTVAEVVMSRCHS
jgi:DNA-binding NarL/FixJ family response regulator